MVRAIAERKRLTQEREQYFRFFRLSTEPMCIADPFGCFKQVNPAFVRLTGFAESELVAKPFLEFVLPADRQKTADEMKLQVTSRPSMHFENRYVCKDGRTIVLSWTAYYDENDGVTYATARDITDLKQAEAMLRKLSIAVEQSPASVVIADLDGCIQYVNPRFTAVAGYSATEAIGQNPRILQSGQTDKQIYLDMWAKLTDGLAWHGELLNKRKNGELYWEESHIAPVKNPAGAITHYVAVKIDITERKRIERVAERERLRLQTILRTASDGIHILDSDGVLVEANEAFLNMLGYDASAIGRLRVSDWAQTSVADSQSRIGHLIARHIPEVFEARHRRRDGVILDVEISASGIEIEGKGYIYAASRDIGERKRAEQELRIAATAFEAQEGMFVTDADNVILRVNRAFTEITGYTAAEVVGRKTDLLKSGRHDAAFYAHMWESLRCHGVWQGEIWNRRKNGEVYPEWLTITAVKSDAGQVTHYVATLTDITLRKAAEDEIKHLAFYDPLTRLPNRRLLLDRLQQALASGTRSGREGALLFIDLDNFKTLNDTLGHDIGDLLLQNVAQRLANCVRDGDTVARLGGDEFVVMLEDLSENPQDAATQTETVGEKILVSLNRPYLLAGHLYHSTPSIGVTLFDDHLNSVDELLKRADLAMYQAKAAGRNTLRFFDPEMQAAVTARVAMEADLRQGLRQNEFLLYYQPQVDEAGRITGAEVLLRWQHPRRGLMAPADFIPLAEETGLILPLGHWVLETACAQLVAWAARSQTAGLTLAVNVSARQFHHPDFVAQVLAVLGQTGADPYKLELELTESLLLDDVEDIIAKMTALKAHGVSFALDDFGTGYSSLSYLKRLPLDQLKIDQSFVRDILTDSNDAAIARTIVALAQSMGLGVIAEGVETEAQREFLACQSCHAFQGFLFGRPLPVDEFDLLFQDRG